MSLDLRQLRQLTALGQYRSFAKAARALGISQPALSKGIRLVEEVLQARLFERSARGTAPTAVGELVLSRAGPLLRGVADLVTEVERLRGLSEGSLAVGAGFWPYEICAGPALGRLATRHPELHLRLVQGDWRTLPREVASGSLDLAIADVAAAEREPGLRVERLGEWYGTFFCGAGHPLAGGARLSFEALCRFPFALPALPVRIAPIFTRAGAAGRIDPVTGDFVPSLAVDSVGLMKRLVGETSAIGWAPWQLIEREVAGGLLVPLDVDSPWARLDYGIIRLRDRTSTPAEDAFVAEVHRVERELAAAERAREPRPARRRRRAQGRAEGRRRNTDSASAVRPRRR